MTDYLAALNEPDLAAFYRRLAGAVSALVGGDSLAATLLLHWLDGKGRDKTFDARYVKNLKEVRSYLRNTARLIFLSIKQTPGGTIGGVVPRIKGIITAGPPEGPYSMHLEGNVEAPLTIQVKLGAAMTFGMGILNAQDKQELDALYGLHGFTVVSDVVMSATKTASPKQYNVKFDRWTSRATDRYHWTAGKHITVPNPDYNSAAKYAVAPQDKFIVIYHDNALRVEKAGLAMPFDDESTPWDESDPAVVGPATVSL
jgi:hypothetical protein